MDDKKESDRILGLTRASVGKRVRRSPKVHPFLYVYRLGHPAALWFCVVPFLDANGEKKLRRKNFRDQKFGGKDKALAAAQKWRDAQVATDEVRQAMGDQRPLRVFTEISDATPFGVVGVRPAFRDRPLGGNMCVTAHGGRKRSFSMRKHGLWGAFQMAVEQRCKWIGAETPNRDDLKVRFNQWIGKNDELLEHYELDHE